MDISSNTLKGKFCFPSNKSPFTIELHPCGSNDDEKRAAFKEHENVVNSICPRFSEDGTKIIIELYVRAQ